MDAEKVLGLVAGHLDRIGAPWALAGGFALNALGFARLTKDVDLVVDESGREPLLHALMAEGFVVLYASEGYSNLLHSDPALGRLDLIWLDGETSRKVFAGCREVAGPGSRSIRVPRPEHLLAMKAAAIANDPDRGIRDLADVQFLLRLPGIDDNEVRGYFAKRGILDIWERLHRRR
jgi:hypothetical protein